MSRKLKVLVVVVAVAAMLGIIGGTVYAASGGGAGWCPPWDRACGQGNSSGCCGGNGEQLRDGSCH
ncbi:MAG: hypothetical protein FJ020_05145 [Chloroflexi bacterium]|nr:hypothetical protein [Chloroflexota bacterium]